MDARLPADLPLLLRLVLLLCLTVLLLLPPHSLYMGLSIPYYFGDYTTKHGMGPIQTSSLVFNNIFNSIFHTAAAVALMLTLFLDNTIPGSDEERGLHVWTTLVVDEAGNETDWWEDDHLNRVSSSYVYYNVWLCPSMFQCVVDE
jgi:hypothetical protein